jgi:hypothetical protein
MLAGVSSPVMDLISPYGARRDQVASARGQAGEEAARTAPDVGGAQQNGKLSAEDERRVMELKKTDRAVRQHEQAHMAAGGNLVTSGPSFEYETGPDGQRYAVAGEVHIDTSKGRTPEDTAQRAARIRAAALAPADPSGQDRSVAAQAAQMQMDALQEIARQQMEDGKGNVPEGGAPAVPEMSPFPGATAAGQEREGAQASQINPSASPDASVRQKTTELYQDMARFMEGAASSLSAYA